MLFPVIVIANDAQEKKKKKLDSQDQIREWGERAHSQERESPDTVY